MFSLYASILTLLICNIVMIEQLDINYVGGCENSLHATVTNLRSRNMSLYCYPVYLYTIAIE